MANILSVQMFGNFSMAFNGQPLVAEKVHKESQFNRLMMVLLHYRETGVTRDKLEELVIGEREMDEQHSSLRVIIYKAKQKLIKLGLPEDDPLIYLDKGTYRFTDTIQVEEDATSFLSYINEANSMDGAEDDEALQRRLDLLQKAIYLYKGEFLSQYLGESWVYQEAKKYRTQFKLCVDQAAEILKTKKDYGALEALGRFASNVDPFCDWEILTMEALVETDRTDEATAFYADVVDKYMFECGIYPSKELVAVMDRLGDQMNHAVEILEHIQEGLNEEHFDAVGGYYCSYPVFQGIYQMAMRTMERTGHVAYLMLCTLVDGKGVALKEDAKLAQYSEEMKEAIRLSVRHGDVFTRYGKSQYVILLANTVQENCELVQTRINQHFFKNKKTAAVKYHVNSIIGKM